MSKRKAERQITDRDDVDNLVGNNPQGDGKWEAADKNVISYRRIVKVRRKLGGTGVSATPTPSSTSPSRDFTFTTFSSSPTPATTTNFLTSTFTSTFATSTTSPSGGTFATNFTPSKPFTFPSFPATSSPGTSSSATNSPASVKPTPPATPTPSTPTTSSPTSTTTPTRTTTSPTSSPFTVPSSSSTLPSFNFSSSSTTSPSPSPSSTAAAQTWPSFSFSSTPTSSSTSSIGAPPSTSPANTSSTSGTSAWPTFDFGKSTSPSSTPKWPSFKDPLKPATFSYTPSVSEGDSSKKETVKYNFNNVFSSFGEKPKAGVPSTDTVTTPTETGVIGVNIKDPLSPVVKPATRVVSTSGKPELKKLNTVITGEEEEELLFQARAKLYELVKNDDGKFEWKERGVGVMKVNKMRGSGQSRLLMRMESSLRLMLNASILPVVSAKKTTEKSAQFTCINSAGEATKLSSYTIKVSKPQDIVSFVDVVEECKREAENKKKETGEEPKPDAEDAKEKKVEKTEVEKGNDGENQEEKKDDGDESK